MLKKIILGLVIISAMSSNVRADDEMDPITGAIIYGTASVAGVLIGAAGLESYNQLNNNDNNNNNNNNDGGFQLNPDTSTWN